MTFYDFMVFFAVLAARKLQFFTVFIGNILAKSKL